MSIPDLERDGQSFGSLKIPRPWHVPPVEVERSERRGRSFGDS
jgi:hypothetical protein